MSNDTLSRSEKILLAMFELSKDSTKSLRYEDIVVKVYELFPDNFHLKGYRQYPDSGDLVHKPLYTNLKKAGFLRSSNKMFSLTVRGLDEARRLSGKSKPVKNDTSRLSRSTATEILRMKGLEGFALYLTGKTDDIIEADLYSFLGVSVRTKPEELTGRIAVVGTALDEARKSGFEPKLVKSLTEYYGFLQKKLGKAVFDVVR
ncbi:MAG: hypothetical protein QY323_02730 [Patescibacteria group bacterium]|nr:MAG: hypothetical protein QY323_02730 [Patescibacteria group bacterium]